MTHGEDVLDEVDGVDELDSDFENTHLPHDPRSPEEQIRLQSTLFRAWAVQQSVTDLKRRKRPGTKDGLPLPVPASVSDIIGQQERQHIITSPREYQLELFERAKTENTIAVLDTGTGKTLIAVLLLRHVTDQELEDRLEGKPPRVALFLVPFVNLVFQQHAVLESNLDYQVARVIGSMRTDLWSKERWMELFNAHKIIVCTAEILHKCLGHGFIRMDQINLLIFDEAHHAKLQHPYCKIMRDYYASLPDDLRRPKIFGMTASPVDIKADEAEDVVEAAMHLEQTLFCKIATTKNLAALQTNVHRPKESVRSYSAPRAPLWTQFSIQLCAKFRFEFLRKLAGRSAMVNAHLGDWCANMFWKLVLPDSVKDRSDVHLERAAGIGRGSDADLIRKDRDLAEMKEVLHYIDAFDTPTPRRDTFSAKVNLLLEILDEFFGRENDSRCIIFVEERYTAKLLALLLQNLNHRHIRAASLVGTSSKDYLSASTSFRDQVVALLEFRRGSVNCLFATSVAEEGLDIPNCNLIIRFDPCRTMIQYIQSRGRARHHNSYLVHMLESGNQVHRMMLDDNAQAEMIMRRFCTSIPKDRLLTGDEDLLNIKADPSILPYEIEETGAKLTSANCVSILSEFCSALDSMDGELLRPAYIVHPATGGFLCEIIMPASSPVRGKAGKIKVRKLQAKCSAAYEVCMELLQKGQLDKNMLPIYAKRARLMANARLAADMYGKQGGILIRDKPHRWMQGSSVTHLYGVHIDFSDGLNRQHEAAIMLARCTLTDIADFPIFLNDGRCTNVQLRSSNSSIEVDPAMLDQLTRFTLLFFKDVFNKTYEFDPIKMPYWIVPASAIPDDGSFDICSTIRWDALGQTESKMDKYHNWHANMPIADLENKFLVDPWHGGKRYFTNSVAANLSAGDVDPTEKTSERPAKTIIDNTVSLFKKSKQRVSWDMQQPVLSAERVLFRRNMLAPPDEKELHQRQSCYICPQPLRLSQLSAAFAATAFALPAIIYRIESHLVALEGCAHIGLDIKPSLALEAFTKDSNGNEGYEMQPQNIKFERGMGRNYERLELFGDTFLKMTTTIATYAKNPADTEYDYHVTRMVQLCNRNLYERSLELDLAQFIRTSAFSRREWYPTGIKLLAGKGATKAENKAQTRSLSKKTIADVSEALIGAALCSHYLPGAWRPGDWGPAIEAVSKLVKSDTHDMREWSDYRRALIVLPWQLKASRASELHLLGQVSREDGYQFRNARLLQAAFTHPSMSGQQDEVKSYQQLEFLGDAMIDMVCVSHLFYTYTDKDPGWLTEHKMAMVSNKFLGALCIKLGFHRHLRHQSADLGTLTKHYSLELADAEEKSKGAMDYWTAVKDPPKALADIVEAYVGGLFVDSDFDFNEVQRFFDQHILPFFTDMEAYDAFAHDHPVTRIHRLLQVSYGCREFRLMVQEMPTNDDGTDKSVAGVIIHEKVIGGDMGQSSKYAKVRAAAKAYAELDGMSLSDFRARFRCDCRPDAGADTTKTTL